MDARIPEHHQTVIELLIQRVSHFQKAYDILAGTATDELTIDHVNAAMDALEADLPSPLKATLFDLGRLLTGSLPTDDIASLAPPLKIYSPET